MHLLFYSIEPGSRYQLKSSGHWQSWFISGAQPKHGTFKGSSCHKKVYLRRSKLCFNKLSFQQCGKLKDHCSLQQSFLSLAPILLKGWMTRAFTKSHTNQSTIWNFQKLFSNFVKWGKKSSFLHVWRTDTNCCIFFFEQQPAKNLRRGDWLNDWMTADELEGGRERETFFERPSSSFLPSNKTHSLTLCCSTKNRWTRERTDGRMKERC